MDRINASSFPINQALRAYAQAPRAGRPGGAPFAAHVSGVHRATAPLAPNAPQQTQTPRATDAADTVGRIQPDRSAQRAASISQLVGGKVDAIDLGSDVAAVKGPKPMTTSAGTYTIYPQAADRNQAATGVAYSASLGGSLDIRG